ncbi:hypothetical protein MTP03_41370 [Tsukamurella sp. PLM1]|nr:hypothetical protein MTP03_41370 [Tsukamurella sp. PLM1]
MLAAFSISPMGGLDGTGGAADGGVAAAVAEAVAIVRASGLPNETTSMFTTIEGEWDEVMGVIKACVDRLAETAPRVSLVVKCDIRPGHTGQLSAKVERVEKHLRSGGTLTAPAVVRSSVTPLHPGSEVRTPAGGTVEQQTVRAEDVHELGVQTVRLLAVAPIPVRRFQPATHQQAVALDPPLGGEALLLLALAVELADHQVRPEEIRPGFEGARLVEELALQFGAGNLRPFQHQRPAPGLTHRIRQRRALSERGAENGDPPAPAEATDRRRQLVRRHPHPQRRVDRAHGLLERARQRQVYGRPRDRRHRDPVHDGDVLGIQSSPVHPPAPSLPPPRFPSRVNSTVR